LEIATLPSGVPLTINFTEAGNGSCRKDRNRRNYSSEKQEIDRGEFHSA
jgi:hypothetical protein